MKQSRLRDKQVTEAKLKNTNSRN